MAVRHEIQLPLQILQVAVSEVVQFYRLKLDFNLMVYELWNAKDILGHITFWHESFARNIDDLANHRKPNVLSGKLSEVNERSVETTRPIPVQDLIDRMLKAQSIIERHIFNDSIVEIPYRKGSRRYSRNEHLDIVAQHIRRHLKDVKKHYKI